MNDTHGMMNRPQCLQGGVKMIQFDNLVQLEDVEKHYGIHIVVGVKGFLLTFGRTING